MRKNASPRIKGVVDGVVVEIGEATGVDVGEAEQSAGKIRGVIMGSEHAAEVAVEHGFGCFSGTKIKRFKE